MAILETHINIELLLELYSLIDSSISDRNSSAEPTDKLLV